MFLILMHGLILFVLYRDTMRYVKQFGQAQVDPYTLSTLILLWVSTCLLFINIPWMILGLIKSEKVNKWLEQNHNILVSTMEFCKIFSKALFTLAIAFTATRWVKQIIQIKMLP